MLKEQDEFSEIVEQEPTGERLIEEMYLDSPERYLIYLFHIATYKFARIYTDGKVVLDYGCGSGYGTNLIAASCKNIIGVDIAREAIEYAKSRYQANNLAYRQIEKAHKSPLPFADATFDTVLSFQVIEHIAEANSYLSEIYRVLKPGGTFLCATPDRSTRFLIPWQKPWNIWHVHEYDGAGLKQALSPFFPSLELLHMGGTADVLKIELRRTQKIMWLTLPFTLPFIPEAIRTTALKWLKRLASQRKSKHKMAARPVFSFGESDIRIAPEVSPSVNLIAVARKE
jgi:SAM-dependent methyltransferase